ncbi:acyl carrier protein [Nonomuraea jabiensis]|uniref:Act minimal PKS acyl carrier protein n=1 Tax=Nonomuraea jabiensis TaxID=882448 RepID=A0A7W9GG65_9ACTN|nr:acyl carrier protein [Nonomuraea jabiensis]MBB5783195.1 act minimal PKS acyl carrier protein [Nonomuraea jabiensis]
MKPLTLAGLATILREVAGEDDAATLEGDIADVPFAELGYDSIAVLEMAACLSRDYGVNLSDEDVLGDATPRKVLELAGTEIAPAP